MVYAYHDTPIGRLLLVADSRGIRQIDFPNSHAGRAIPADWVEDRGALDPARRQLDAYFAGKLKRFDLALAPDGTPFQLKVYDALQRVAYGQTISYGELARRIGNPLAARAVGGANARNPIPIVIPCHRVIGAGGALVGFGGGLDIKARLLELERSVSGEKPVVG